MTTTSMAPARRPNLRHILNAHLHKEFRDHRTGLIGLAAMVIAFGLLLSVALDPLWVETQLASGLTLGTLFCAVVLFAPDLSEQRQQTLGFLDRVPCGFHTVFFCKVLFLLLVIGGFTLLAYGLATVLRAVFTEANLDLILVQTDLIFALVISSTLACAFWMLAASWWLPRSLLAVPVTALLLALIALPSWLLLPSWFFDRELTDLGADLPALFLLCAHPMVALAAAWWSFVGGRRHGRGPIRSGLRGLAVAGLACVGLTGISANVAGEWRDPDPGKLRIQHGVVGADGRYAFVGAYHRGHSWPPILLTIDLRTGTAKRIESTGFATSPRGLSPYNWPGSNPELVYHEIGDPDQGLIRILDARTLEVLAENHYRQPYRRLEDRCRASLRAESPIVLPDGRKCWVFDRALEVDDGDGHRTMLGRRETRELGYFVPYGFGVLGTGRGENRRRGWNVAYDFIREVRFDFPEDWSVAGCLAEGWLVATEKSRRARRRAVLGGWMLYDPVLESTRPALGMLDGDEVIRVTAAGKVLVRSKSDPDDGTAGLFRVDVGRGTRDALEIPGVPAMVFRGYSYPERASNGRDVFRIHADGRFCLTTLLPSSKRFTSPVPAYRFVGSVSASGLITISHRGTLERVDVETGSREQLFPRQAKF